MVPNAKTIVTLNSQKGIRIYGVKIDEE